MSHQLFTDLSIEQQEVVAGGSDFQLDTTVFKAAKNTLFGGSSSGPDGSKAFSEGSSTKVATAGLAFLGLETKDVPGIKGYWK